MVVMNIIIIIIIICFYCIPYHFLPYVSMVANIDVH